MPDNTERSPVKSRNMRKFRYADPKSKYSRNRVIGQMIKFFIGWNVLGYLAWQQLKSRARQMDPEFDKKKSGEQMLSMFGYKDVKMKHVKIKIGSDGLSMQGMEAATDNSSDSSNNSEKQSRSTEERPEPTTEKSNKR